MDTYLDEAFIDEGLLTEQERQELQSEYRQMVDTVEKKYILQQQQYMQEEDELYEKLAKEAGFSGYDTGNDSYNRCYEKYIRDPGKAEESVVERLKDFGMRKIESKEYYSLMKRSEQTGNDEHKEKIWLKQLYLNKVLERIMPRTVKYIDNYGQPIPKPRTYNRYDEETKKALNKPLTRRYTVGKGTQVKGVEIDAGICSVISQLWDSGIRTNACCSGMVVDHPYERFETNDRFGRWKKGDLVKIHSSVNSAYLSLPFKDNHPEMMEKAIEKAHGWGWTTEKRKVYDEDSLVFYPPHCLDGTSYGTVLHEAADLKNSFLQSGEASDEEEAVRMAHSLVEKNHGGVIRFTDRMLGYNFRRLCEGLADVIHRIRKEERKQNIEKGKAVNEYWYDKEAPQLTPQQVKAVFDRAGIELDMSSVNRPLDHSCVFIVHQDKARLAAADEPAMPWTMVNENHNLSYLMAQQIKGTPSVSSDTKKVSIMIHPDPQSSEVSRQFTIKKELSDYAYYKYFAGEDDMNRFFSNHFTKELYQAAQHAYDHGLQKIVDETNPQTIVDGRQFEKEMAVSNIRIRKGMDNNMYISCKVFGEQQLSKRMNQLDSNYYNMRMRASDKAYNGVAPELASKYFKDEIELTRNLQQEEGRGMKR